MHLPFAVASSVLRPRQLLEKEEVGRARLLVIEMRGRDSDRDLPKCNGRSFCTLILVEILAISRSSGSALMTTFVFTFQRCYYKATETGKRHV